MVTLRLPGWGVATMNSSEIDQQDDDFFLNMRLTDTDRSQSWNFPDGVGLPELGTYGVGSASPSRGLSRYGSLGSLGLMDEQFSRAPLTRGSSLALPALPDIEPSAGLARPKVNTLKRVSSDVERLTAQADSSLMRPPAAVSSSGAPLATLSSMAVKQEHLVEIESRTGLSGSCEEALVGSVYKISSNEPVPLGPSDGDDGQWPRYQVLFNERYSLKLSLPQSVLQSLQSSNQPVRGRLRMRVDIQDSARRAKVESQLTRAEEHDELAIEDSVQVMSVAELREFARKGLEYKRWLTETLESLTTAEYFQHVCQQESGSGMSSSNNDGESILFLSRHDDLLRTLLKMIRQGSTGPQTRLLPPLPMTPFPYSAATSGVVIARGPVDAKTEFQDQFLNHAFFRQTRERQTPADVQWRALQPNIECLVGCDYSSSNRADRLPLAKDNCRNDFDVQVSISQPIIPILFRILDPLFVVKMRTKSKDEAQMMVLTFELDVPASTHHGLVGSQETFTTAVHMLLSHKATFYKNRTGTKRKPNARATRQDSVVNASNPKSAPALVTSDGLESDLVSAGAGAAGLSKRKRK